MQFEQYVTVLCTSANIFILVYTFVRHLRLWKNSVPGLTQFLALTGLSVVFSVMGQLSLVLQDKQAMGTAFLLASLTTPWANSLFLMMILQLTASSKSSLYRGQKWFLVGPAVFTVIGLFNGRHHWVMTDVYRIAGTTEVVAVPGVFALVISAYSLVMSLTGVICIFRSRSEGPIKDRRIHWLLVVTTSISFIMMVLEAAFEPLDRLQVSHFFVWLPVALMGYICFGYLMTARRRALQVIDEIYVVFDARGNCVDYNKNATAFFTHYLGNPCPQQSELFALLCAQEGEKVDGREFRVEKGDVSKYYEAKEFRISGSLNQHCGSGFTLRETTQYAAKMSRLSILADHDALTGARNRRALHAFAADLFPRAAARGTAVTLMMLDIDHFKQVNDTYGHIAGDDILKGLCVRVKENLREQDILFRYGGEEFVVLSEGLDKARADALAERIRLAVQHRGFDTVAGHLSITVSIGVYTRLPRSGDTIDGFLEVADRRLYLAKQTGRNRVQSDEMSR